MSERIQYESITPSGFFGNSSNNIQTRENFLTSEELSLLINEAKSINIWDNTETKYNENGTIIYFNDFWLDRVCGPETLLKYKPDVFYTVRNIQDRLIKEVNAFFNLEATCTGPTIVKWFPGQEQIPHADKELHDGPDAGLPNDFPHYDIAGLFYLNDDYEGGELYFPQHDITIKPKAGAAYFFPGDKNYLHGVTKVISGERFTCPGFLTVLKHL